mgnify:CR=1 FL=1
MRCEKNWPAVKQALQSNVDVALTLFRDGSGPPRAAFAELTAAQRFSAPQKCDFGDTEADTPSRSG